MVSERSGWNGGWGCGELEPLGGAEGHALCAGEPLGDGKGEGGPAVLGVILRKSRAAARAFFRGGAECEVVKSKWAGWSAAAMEETLAPLRERLREKRSMASWRVTNLCSLSRSSRLSMAQPLPAACSSSVISWSPEAPSRNVPVLPFGKTSENSRTDFGNAARSSGYCLGSFGDSGGGSGGRGMGAYVVVVCVVVVTLPGNA